MECEFCGEEVSDGSLACPRCGSPVSKPPAEGEGESPAAVRDGLPPERTERKNGRAMPSDSGEGGRFDWRKPRSLALIGAASLLLVALVSTAAYFSFFRKKESPAQDPIAVVKDFCNKVLSGDLDEISPMSLPTSNYQNELSEVVKPYRKLGSLTIEDLGARTEQVDDSDASVEITKFVVRVEDPKGSYEYIDLLSITKPNALRTTVNLIKRNGKWMVSY